VIASVGDSLAKTSLAAGVDDVVGVGVGVAARTGVSVTHVSHPAQLVVAIFGNEMKITLLAKIFRFLLQQFSFSFVPLGEILFFISFSFY